MSVLSRTNFIHAQRIDLADLKSIDSFVASDFRALIKFICGDSPYIVDGCKIVNKIGNRVFIQTNNLFLFLPNSSSGSFFRESSDAEDTELTLPTNAQRVFIELTVKRETRSPVTKGFWDSLAPTPDNENGSEYLAQADLEDALTMEIAYNLTGFTDGSIPIATCTVVAGNITKVIDNRNMFFQSGNGGVHPNKKYTSPFSPNRKDSPIIGFNVGDEDGSPFQDRDVLGALNPAGFRSLKDWINGIAMVLADIQGSPVWFATRGANQIIRDLSLKQLFLNTFGQSVDASDNCWFSWNRDSNNLKDNKLRTIGTDSIKITNNYNGLSYQIVGSYSSDRITDSVNFESPVVPDGANLFIKLQNDVLLNGKNLVWGDIDGTGLISSELTVSGSAGDFSGIAVGDYIRKESVQNIWYKVVGYVSGGTLFEPVEGTLVPDSAIELKIDKSIDNVNTEPLYFFRTRYSNSDFVVESLSFDERLTGEFQSTEYFWLGRRVGDLFTFRDYGTLSAGEDTRTLNGQADNAIRPQNIESVIYPNARFQSVGGVPQVRNFDGVSYTYSSSPVIEIKKQFIENWIANDSGNNRSHAIFQLACDGSHGLYFENDGDELWVRLSESVGTHTLAFGDLSGDNEYAIYPYNNVPVASRANFNTFLVARRQDIGSTPYLVFTDGTMLSSQGEHHIAQTAFDSKVIHNNGRVLKVVNAISDYQISFGDELIMVDKQDTSLLTVTLPDTTNQECYVGTVFEVKDSGGDCSLDNIIRIACFDASENIDGGDYYDIQSEKEGVKIIFTNSGWRII